MTWRDWWVVTQILPFCYGIPVPDLTGTTQFGRLIRDWLSAFRDINFKRFTGTVITVSTKKPVAITMGQIHYCFTSGGA